MTDCTVAAPVRATKPPARQKAAPSPAPERVVEQATTKAPVSDDEKTVAATAAAQLQSIYDAHWADLGVYAAGLLTMAIRGLETIQEFQDDADRGDVFHRAAAAISGALAITRAAQPEGAVIGPLETVFQLLESADIGYGFEQEPCEALAAGIRAGAKPFRDRPQPPIRRVEDDAEYQGLCKLTRDQLIQVLEMAAGNLAILDQLLMSAQAEKDDHACALFIEAAQALVSHCGGMVDSAAGGAILGGHDRWNFGPNFHKADAA